MYVVKVWKGTILVGLSNEPIGDREEAEKVAAITRKLYPEENGFRVEVSPYLESEVEAFRSSGAVVSSIEEIAIEQYRAALVDFYKKLLRSLGQPPEDLPPVSDGEVTWTPVERTRALS